MTFLWIGYGCSSQKFQSMEIEIILKINNSWTDENGVHFSKGYKTLWETVKRHTPCSCKLLSESYLLQRPWLKA